MRFVKAVAATVLCGLVAGSILAGSRPAHAGDATPNLSAFEDASGQVRTYNTHGILNPDNPFFQSLGTNGRACVTCHQASQGWTITPEGVSARFDATDGLDPIFRTNDGSNCDGADVSTTAARRAAFSMLMSRGLIRIAIVPPTAAEGAEFTVESVDDPYHCAPSTAVSMYRRPLPSTNLPFLSAVMWDGRESPAGTTVRDNLLSQARDATLGHAQASLSPTDAELQQIVDFETGLYTAQARDHAAANLNAQGAAGGPVAASSLPFFIGINDPLGHNPTGAAFNPVAFTLFDGWISVKGSDSTTAARHAIARGQAIFNTRQIAITGVGGLNDVLNVASIPGTCTTCHDTPNVGDHSVKAPLNIGLTDASRRTPDMPLYTLRRISTGETVQTTDPGRAIITGRWSDIGRFKGPILRGLAARAPYFHNGSAATLGDAVDFYNTRFSLELTAQEKSDLVAFLSAL